MKLLRLIRQLRFLAVSTLVAILAFHALPVSATFLQNRLIDDSVFSDTTTMSTSQIDAFLNSKSSSCISTNHGFSAPDPTGYTPSGGFTYGGNVSAGKVIYDAAQVYGINPQVLIVTLQKEQSLVTGGGGCSTLAYAAAAGYGCPDGGTTHSYSGLNLYTLNGTTVTSVSGTCVNSSLKAGFSQQVIRAAWLLRFGQQRSLGNIGWAVISGSWDNSDDPETCYGGPMTQGNRQACPSGPTVFYDGYTTIDGTAVHMDTGATASLYWYTPHFAGNQNFVSLFESYFGSTLTPNYSASYFSESSFPTLSQGQSSTMMLEYKNTGTDTWYDSTTAGAHFTQPVVLATSNPVNRASDFATPAWSSVSRPATTFSVVYEADGSTLAPDQHAVLPGEVARYDIPIQAPKDEPPGSYSEYFLPIREAAPGFSWYMGADTVHMVVNVTSGVKAAYQSESPFPTMHQNEAASLYFSFKNTGSLSWYDSTTAGANNDFGVELDTTGPVGRASGFNTTGWAASNRATTVFTNVYEADNTTLAANQHVVGPGQIARFQLNITSKLSQNPGTYREYFYLARHGARASSVDNSGVYEDITITPAGYNASYVSQSAYPTVAKTQGTAISFHLKNTGSTTWYDDASWLGGLYPVHFATSWPVNRGSIFSFGWPSVSRPTKVFNKVYEADNTTLAANQHVVGPGQIAEFSLSIVVPGDVPSGVYNEHFQPVLEYAPGFWWYMGGGVWQAITVP